MLPRPNILLLILGTPESPAVDSSMGPYGPLQSFTTGALSSRGSSLGAIFGCDRSVGQSGMRFSRLRYQN